MQRNLLATRHWTPICWPWNWNIVPNTVSRHQRQFRDQSVEMLGLFGLFDPIGLNLALDLSSDELLCTRWKIPQPSPFDKASQPAPSFSLKIEPLPMTQTQLRSRQTQQIWTPRKCDAACMLETSGKFKVTASKASITTHSRCKEFLGRLAKIASRPNLMIF